MKKEFIKELAELINKHGLEKEMRDTPDYILAQICVDAMVIFTEAADRRDNWHGFRTAGEKELHKERQNSIIMKKYIGTKEVSAMPMNLGEFIEKTKRNPYANDPNVHYCDEAGYLVKYKDGYESWSPKEVFEEAYKCSETFLDRLHVEHDDLFSKFEKCATFVDSEKFRNVLKDDYPAFLLWLQRDIMGRYAAILEQRMAIANGEKEITTLPRMSFGIAIQALKFGLAIRRKGWNGKGLFVIKQVPAHIESEVIPKMQSLPQSAKDLIMKGKGFIDYTSQCLIYNENTGRADSWVPSISDVFAEDWEIVK